MFLLEDVKSVGDYHSWKVMKVAMLLGFQSSMFCTTNCVKAHTEMCSAICMENRSVPGDEVVSSGSFEIWSFLKAEALCCHCVTTLYVVLLGGNESINN